MAINRKRRKDKKQQIKLNKENYRLSISNPKFILKNIHRIQIFLRNVGYNTIKKSNTTLTWE